MVGLIIFAVAFCIASLVLNLVKAFDGFYDEDEKKVKKIVYGSLLALLAVVSVVQLPYQINERQVGYTITFGRATPVESLGLHWRVPFITKVVKRDATTKGMAIGYIEESDEPLPEDSMMITSDFNFVNVDFYVEYKIADAIQYDFGSSDPEGILYSIAQSCVRNTVGQYPVDEVLTVGKTEIEMKVRSMMEEKLAEHKTGLMLMNVSIQDSEPPTEEVSTAFKAVENAKQKADTVLNDAKTYENQQIPQAQAEADKIIRAAEAKKTERENQAKQEVASFEAIYNEYQQNPETVKMKLYMETMEEILPNMQLIIGNSEVKLVCVNGIEEVN